MGAGLRWRVLLPLYLLLATALGFVDYRVRTHPQRAYDEYVPAVVVNAEPAPGRYRVLSPFVFEGVVRATGLERREAWVLFRWLGLVSVLLAMHWYLAYWFPPGVVVAGNLLLASLLPLTFTNSWGHPDHFVELALFTMGCGLVARGLWWATACVLAVALLNRETSAFLGLLYFAVHPMSRSHVLRTAALAAVSVTVLAGLRWWRGWEFYSPWQLDRNIEFLGLLPAAYDPYYRTYAWFFVLLIAPALWLVVRTWGVQPRFTRVAAAVVVPVFVIISMLFTSIIETRVFTPMFPLLLPGVLFAMFPGDRTQGPEA